MSIDTTPPVRAARTLLPLMLTVVMLQTFTIIGEVFGECPAAPTELVEASVSAEGRSATVGMDGCGQYVVGWEQPFIGGTGNNIDVLVRQYLPDGTASTGRQAVSAPVGFPPPCILGHTRPSIAMSLGGIVRVGWLGRCDDGHPSVGPLVLLLEFPFGATPGQLGVPGGPILPIMHYEPSVGTSDAYGGAVAWEGVEMLPEGVLIGPDEDNPTLIRACGDRCYTEEWLPCVATRNTDGHHAIVWADAESIAVFPHFNTALRIYDDAWALVARLDGPDTNDPSQWVNDPSMEDPSAQLDTTQSSPAVSFVGSDIVVAWIGPRLADCTGTYHIYARRFKFDDVLQPGTLELRDPDPALGEGRAGMFTVDNDPADILDPGDAHPAVALTLDQNDPGRFIVVWNAVVPAGGTYNTEVHGQYFDAKGDAAGAEFRVNQDNSITDPGSPGRAIRRIAKSGQHTVAYGPDDQAVVTWSPGSLPDGVYYTLLPPDHVTTTVTDCTFCNQNPELCLPCLKGDINGDCSVNGLDIQPFVDLVLDAQQVCLNVVDLCPGDVDADGDVDLEDVPLFVGLLLGVSRERLIDDCNENGTADANDIDEGTSLDCNHNYVPDECDIDPADPDGDGEASNDLNTNGIPDECEPDCNSNGTPDDKDIADATSDDVNTNGVPDECEPDCNTNGVPDDWDVSQGTSDDCNTNGKPDECEFDCNTNGVPDDCDIDPTDPDGDGEVSEDCQPNNVPDECDLSRSFAPSFDCNNNGVPDECEMAGNDCNSNGLLDECDIAYGISQDVNQNGIPDECEGGGGGGGSAPMGGSPGGGGFPLPEPIGGGVFEAWLEFYEWFESQTWGPDAGTSGSEQFEMIMDKLAELGLPLANPWMAQPGPSPTPFPMPL